MSLYRPIFVELHPEAVRSRKETRAPRYRPRFGNSPIGPVVITAPLPRSPLPPEPGTSNHPADRSKLGFRVSPRVLRRPAPRVAPDSLAGKDWRLPGEFGTGSMVPYWGAGVAYGPTGEPTRDSAVPKDSESKDVTQTAYAGVSGVVLFALVGFYLYRVVKRGL